MFSAVPTSSTHDPFHQRRFRFSTTDPRSQIRAPPSKGAQNKGKLAFELYANLCVCALEVLLWTLFLEVLLALALAGAFGWWLPVFETCFFSLFARWGFMYWRNEHISAQKDQPIYVSLSGVDRANNEALISRILRCDRAFADFFLNLKNEILRWRLP